MRGLRGLGTLALVALFGASAACGSCGKSTAPVAVVHEASPKDAGATPSVSFAGGLTATVTPANGTITAEVIELPGALEDGGTQSSLSLQVLATLPDGYTLKLTNSTTFDLPLAPGAFVINSAGEPVSLANTRLHHDFDAGTIEQDWEQEYSNSGTGEGTGTFSVTITSAGTFSSNGGGGRSSTNAHGLFSAGLLPESGSDAGVSVTGTF